MAGRLPRPAGLPKTVGRPTIFQSSQEKLAAGARKPGETWEENMRLLKLALAGVCALGLAGTANSAEPVKIRMSWVAPVSNGHRSFWKRRIWRNIWANPTRLNPRAIRERRNDYGDCQ